MIENNIDENMVLTLKCPKNHFFKISFKDFKDGKRCDLCKKERKEYMKEYQKNNPEKFKKATLKWQAKPEVKQRLQEYRKKFYADYWAKKRTEKKVQ